LRVPCPRASSIAMSPPQERNNGYLKPGRFNRVFTRAVNHLVIVLGSQATALRDGERIA